MQFSVVPGKFCRRPAGFAQWGPLRCFLLLQCWFLLLRWLRLLRGRTARRLLLDSGSLKVCKAGSNVDIRWAHRRA